MTRETILIVDDDASTLQLMQFILAVRYRIITAADGNEALRKVEEGTPDLILLDVMLPDCSGVDLCRRILSRHSRQFLPILLISARAEGEIIKAGLEAGAIDYVKKPFSHVELDARVAVALSLRASFIQLERVNTELNQALAQIKTLSGLIPICSHCKKIRDDEGFWSRVESYIAKHSAAEFTHTICPTCARTHFATENLKPPKEPHE